VHGGAIGADDAVVLRSWQRAKATRNFLLHFGYAHGLLSQIVGERHIGLGHEAPDIVAVITQPANQIGGLALLGPAAFTSGQRNRVFCLCSYQDCIVKDTC